MADMMKMMGNNRGMMQRMAGALGMGGGMGGMGGAPSAAEIEKMQAELARLDPKALESLPPEIRNIVPKPGAGKPALPASGKPAAGGLPGLGGFRLPGLGGARPTLPGLPGGKKK
jgi:signal recognition particle subunit SRP54